MWPRFARYTAGVIPEADPSNSSLLRDLQTLDPALLRAARLHVGAAGIEQMKALEHLIAAGQEHTGLVAAVRQVITVLNQGEDSAAKQRLLEETQSLLTLLNQLALIVAQALQQITATPVQRISAERLDDIARQMNGYLSALEALVIRAEQDPDVPQSSLPGLESILTELHSETRRVAAERRQGQVETLRQLAVQAITDLARLQQIPTTQRAEGLESVSRTVHSALEDLSRQDDA